MPAPWSWPHGGELGRRNVRWLRAERVPPIRRAAAGRSGRGAGAVDRDGLENRCTLMGTVGSNPTLSAISQQRASRSVGALAPSTPILRNHKAAMFLHRRNIAVIVEQRAMVFDAERADDDVSCLSDRNAQPPQHAIVSHAAGSKIGIRERHGSVPTQLAFDRCRMGLVSGAWRTSSKMRSSMRRGSLLAAASRLAVAGV
jgi:hypothetical protein